MLTGFSVAGGLLLPNTPFGQACAIGLVPALSVVIGIVVTHAYSNRSVDRELAKEVQNAMYTTLNLKRSVNYVDQRLQVAQGYLRNQNGWEALLEVARAKTATELSLWTAQQASRHWESISESGARQAQTLFGEDDGGESVVDGTSFRPTIRKGDNPRVVRVDDENDEETR